jgi:hypothetical protein
LEKDAKQIIDDTVHRGRDEFGHWVTNPNELSDDWVEEKKLDLYHEEILNTEVEFKGEAIEVPRHPQSEPERRDMAAADLNELHCVT